MDEGSRPESGAEAVAEVAVWALVQSVSEDNIYSMLYEEALSSPNQEMIAVVVVTLEAVTFMGLAQREGVP